MGTGLSDVDMQMLALWEEMKPREATNLRFIAMDADGNFAGQFSVEIDPHGDRYFTLTETSGMWAIKSNLVSNLDKDEADLPKTSIKTREQYKAIMSQAIYKLDLTGIPAEAAFSIPNPLADTSLSTLQGATEISDLFRQPEPLIHTKPYNPDDVSDVVCFPPGKYFVGDPCYAVPRDLWQDFLNGSEGEAIDIEGVGRSVFYSHQYETDDEGICYPADSGLIGITCVDHLDDNELTKLKSLGRLISFSEGEEIARDDDGDELYGEWNEAFQTYHDNSGNIFLGWNWFYRRGWLSDLDEEANDNTVTAAGKLDFQIDNSANITDDQSLIYMWEIISPTNGKLLGRYIGKSSKGTSRPLTHYSRNVANLLAEKPYRKDNPNGFRRIHHALANAVRNGSIVKLVYLSSIAEGEDINQKERYFIASLRSSGSESWQLND
jgi:hypothetical protein